MRSSTALTSILLLSSSTLGAAVQLADLLAFTSSSSCTGGDSIATPESRLNVEAPLPTETAVVRRVVQVLELRDVQPAIVPLQKRETSPDPEIPAANPAAPNAIPVADPNAIPNPAAPNANPAAPAAPGNPALNPAAPAAPAAAAPPPVPTLSLSVQWVETWIGGTLQTWVPVTLTYGGPGYTTQAPEPGRGEIGLGTLTGTVGVTQTVVMGAAATVDAGWFGAAAAAVGVGVGAMGVW